MKSVKRTLLAVPVVLVFCVALAQGATYSCNSCADCTTKLSSAVAGDTVELTADISCDSGSACVDFGSRQDVIFEGNGHAVTRGTSGYYGIRMSVSSAMDTGNTIRNVTVQGFSRGIYLVRNAGNRLAGVRLMGNGTGIDFYNASNNIVEDALIKQNARGIYLSWDSDSNVIRNSSILRNYDAGIFFYISETSEPENNQFYNNVLRNTPAGNVKIDTPFSERNRDLSHIPFVFNQTLDCSQGANIMGCGCLGGNYWETPFEAGDSKSCTDADGNGICDTPYDAIDHATAVIVDAYPLTTPPAGCCANADRDGDGYDVAICNGDDLDDDPISCGPACYPGASEICDGYDNDGDGRVDGTVACQDLVVYKDAYVPGVVAHQSCAEDPLSKKIYCFGGVGYASDYHDDIVVYDPAADTLTPLQNKLPTYRSDLACNYDPATQRIYCFGGYGQVVTCTEWSASGGCIAATATVTRMNEILEFNPLDQSVTTLDTTLPAAMEGMGSVFSAQTGTIFLLGGTSSVHSGNRDTILEFNPVTKALSTRPAVLPTARYDPSCAPDSASGKVYCFGGYNADGGLAEIVEFDPATNEVQIMPTSFPHIIQDTACVEDSVDHLIYCIGGRNGNSIYLDTIHVYDPVADTLTEQATHLLQGRYGQACVEQVSSNKIYCFGGARNVVNLTEIFEYTPDLPIWGDVNTDGLVDLDDPSDTLQVLKGSGSQPLTRKADIIGNRKLGIEETVYQLRKSAGPN